MKKMSVFVAVAVMLVSVAAIAATSLDGNYTFSSRTKDGVQEMTGWTGTMDISDNTMKRNYLNPADKKTKFYEGTMKQDGNVYTLKLTDAYNKEYIGQEHKNKITVAGKTLTMESTDGKFKEVWTKK